MRIGIVNDVVVITEILKKLVTKDNRYEIIAMNNSFHGRTMGALAATGQERVQKGFGPLLPGFKFVSFNDFEALKNSVSDKTVAVLLEIVQGESSRLKVLEIETELAKDKIMSRLLGKNPA